MNSKEVESGKRLLPNMTKASPAKLKLEECKRPEIQIPPEEILMMDDVLGELFKHLDWEGLKSARLVCTKWAELCTHPFQAKAAMMATNFDYFDRSVKEFEGIFPLTTPDSRKFKAIIVEKPSIFTTMVQRPWFRSYGPSLERIQLGIWLEDERELRAFRATSQEFIEPSSLENLLNLCSNLKDLILPMPFLKHFDPNGRPGFPQVVHLNLLQLGPDMDQCPEMGERYQGPPIMPTDLSKTLHLVFGCVASVGTLRLANTEWMSYDGFFKGIQDTPVQRKVLEGVQTLDLGGCTMSPIIIGHLCTVYFSNLRVLTTARFLKFGDDGSVGRLCRFLRRVGPTLEDLTLAERPDSNPVTIPIPDLPKLKSLQISEVNDWRLENIDFILRTPQLKSLRLQMWYEDFYLRSLWGTNPSDMELALTPHMALRELYIYCKANSADDFRTVGRFFPNLAKVFVKVQDEQGNLWHCLSGLASLSKLKVLDMLLDISINTEDLEGLLVSTIPNFLALKTLTLRAEVSSDVPALSGKMFTYGFLKCPTLKSLNLHDIKLSRSGKWNSILKTGGGERLDVHIY